MVEESLVINGPLEPQLRTAGRVLLDQLDKEKAGIVAAFWFLVEDEGIWRLCLATPLVETEGPRKVYTMIRHILSSLPQPNEDEAKLDLSDVAVVNPDQLIVAQLRQQYGKIEQEDSRRIRRTSAPYIYRLI